MYTAAAAAKSLQSCPTLCDPIDGSPLGSPRPWDSPGKNTGVGCHFLLEYMKVKSESEVAQSCPTLSNLMDCSPPGSSVHGIFKARILEWGAIAFSLHNKQFRTSEYPIVASIYGSRISRGWAGHSLALDGLSCAWGLLAGHRSRLVLAWGKSTCLCPPPGQPGAW